MAVDRRCATGVNGFDEKFITIEHTSACMFTRDQNVPAAPFRISILLKANSHREIN
jgi:hypothetical protein